MKLTDMLLIFVIITVPFIVILDLKVNSLNRYAFHKNRLDNVIDSAITDSLSVMTNKSIDKNEIIEVFFNSLSLNMGVSKRQLNMYIPAIVLIQHNGMYIYSGEEHINESGEKVITYLWHPKIYYHYSDQKYIYNLTLTDEVMVYDKANDFYYYNNYRKLRKTLEQSIIDKNNFSLFKQERIIRKIEKEISNAINSHNKLAKTYGLNYNFYIPRLSEDLWHTSVSDIGMIVFFQGYPMGTQGEVYNNYALGGANIIKNKIFLIVISDEGRLEYHRTSCDHLQGLSENKQKVIVNSKEEAAKKGAFPCRKCNP